MSTSLRRIGALVLPVLAFLAAGLGPVRADARPVPSGGVVRAVFDGDTVLLETGEKVRYLGIDTPEVNHSGTRGDCYGQEARKANSELVLGRKVSLRYEGRRRDSYGRLLAYVFTSDGIFVNLELIKSGYALVYRSRRPFETLPDFLKAQRDAMENRRGLWNACSVEPSPYYWGDQKRYVFHRPRCPIGRKTPKRSRVRFSSRLPALEEGFRPCRLCRP